MAPSSPERDHLVVRLFQRDSEWNQRAETTSAIQAWRMIRRTNVGYRTDPKVESRYICQMPSYSVRIHHGDYSSTGTVDLPDDDAARQEASAVCADLIRGVIPSLTAGREYRLEVADQTGTVLRVLRLTAESY
jgi:hypothetical protein